MMAYPAPVVGASQWLTHGLEWAPWFICTSCGGGELPWSLGRGLAAMDTVSQSHVQILLCPGNDVQCERLDSGEVCPGEKKQEQHLPNGIVGVGMSGEEASGT